MFLFVLPYCTRDLKQARGARAVNDKQLNFRVKKKPQTTEYVYILHI